MVNRRGVAERNRGYNRRGDHCVVRITFPFGEGGPLAVDEVIFNATYRNLIRLASQSTFPIGEGSTGGEPPPYGYIYHIISNIPIYTRIFERTTNGSRLRARSPLCLLQREKVDFA